LQIYRQENALIQQLPKALESQDYVHFWAAREGANTAYSSKENSGGGEFIFFVSEWF